MEINVVSGNVEAALRNLKRQLQREGVFKTLKLKRHFEKPSKKKARKAAEAYKRRKKFRKYED